MANCKSAHLANRSILRISGDNALGFLQGLITNNMTQVSAEHAIYAGLLTPQGKILFDFFVVSGDNGAGAIFLIDVPRDMAAGLAKRLAFYRLRAKIEIEDVSDSHIVMAQWGGSAPASGADGQSITFVDPRFDKLGWRMITRGTATEATSLMADCYVVGESDYEAHRIALAVPRGGSDFHYEEHFPHDACFDQLCGVDFKKGCYIGQEVVSRVHHRATARKRFMVVSGSLSGADTGANLSIDDRAIGTLGSIAEDAAIALVRLDRAAPAIANDRKVCLDGQPVTLSIPPWAGYSMQDFIKKNEDTQA